LLLYNKLGNESEDAKMSFPEEEQPKSIKPASSGGESTPGEPASPDEEPNPGVPAPSEETPSGEVVYPEAILPEDFTPLDRTGRKARARRRREHRKLVMPTADERAASLDGLARRAFPSFDFFVFALLCGAVLGAAYLMDSPAMLLLAILLAPLLTPWVGLVLAIQTGSWRFFFLTLGCVLVACLLVFLTGALAGWTGHLWLHLPLSQANLHAHLWWPDLFLVVLGAVLLTISFVRSENKPVLPSIGAVLAALGGGGGGGAGCCIHLAGWSAGLPGPSGVGFAGRRHHPGRPALQTIESRRLSPAHFHGAAFPGCAGKLYRVDQGHPG
jgi:hypothetical protein